MMKSMKFLFAAILALMPNLYWSPTADAQVWPNEPAGTLLTDQPFSSLTSPSGWGTYYNTNCSVVQASLNGAVSPTNVLRMTRLSTGYGGCNQAYNVKIGPSVFIGAYWRPSDPFTGWANLSNKLFVLQSTASNGNGSSLWLWMYGDTSSGPFHLAFLVEGLGVDNSHIARCGSFTSCAFHGTETTVTLGVPHKIEEYVKRSTTESSQDGIVKVWLDGVLVISQTNLNIASGDWYQVAISPSWDGPVDAPFTQAIHEWDHIHISSPSGVASGGTTQPTATGPATPCCLTVN